MYGFPSSGWLKFPSYKTTKDECIYIIKVIYALYVGDRCQPYSVVSCDRHAKSLYSTSTLCVINHTKRSWIFLHQVKVASFVNISSFQMTGHGQLIGRGQNASFYRNGCRNSSYTKVRIYTHN